MPIDECYHNRHGSYDCPLNGTITPSSTHLFTGHRPFNTNISGAFYTPGAPSSSSTSHQNAAYDRPHDISNEFCGVVLQRGPAGGVTTTPWGSGDKLSSVEGASIQLPGVLDDVFSSVQGPSRLMPYRGEQEASLSQQSRSPGRAQQTGRANRMPRPYSKKLPCSFVEVSPVTSTTLELVAIPPRPVLVGVPQGFLELQQKIYETSSSGFQDFESCTVVYEKAPAFSMLVEQHIKECVPDYATFPFAQTKFAQKITYFYQFVGAPTLHKRQVSVLHTKHGETTQPNKGHLAMYAARELRRYIARLNDFPYKLDQLFLLYIVHRSKGSIQAHIGVKDPAATTS